MHKKIISNFIEHRIIILIALVCIVMFAINGSFLSFTNIISILMKISIEGIIVIGMAYLIILGEIDLSVGEIMGLSCFFVIFFQQFGIIPGVIAGIACGLVVGIINGILVVKAKLPSIAVTLGMMIFLNGMIFVLTKLDSISGTNPEFSKIAVTSVAGIPAFIFVMILLIILFELILRKTSYGRNIYAVGGNVQASRYANIKVNKIKISAFILTGILSGLAGVFLVSRFNIASGALGATTPLFVITAVLIGGVSLSGGEGNVFKAFQGLLLVGVVENAMIMLKLYSSVKLIVMGLLLILTLIVDSIHTTKEKYK